MNRLRHILRSIAGPLSAFVFVMLFAVMAAGASIWADEAMQPQQFAAFDLPDLPEPDALPSALPR